MYHILKSSVEVSESRKGKPPSTAPCSLFSISTWISSCCSTPLPTYPKCIYAYHVQLNPQQICFPFSVPYLSKCQHDDFCCSGQKNDNNFLFLSLPPPQISLIGYTIGLHLQNLFIIHPLLTLTTTDTSRQAVLSSQQDQ